MAYVDHVYPDHRTYRGAVTFSRGFRNAWLDGWRDEDRKRDRTRRQGQCDPCPTHGGARCGYRVGDPLPCTRAPLDGFTILLGAQHEEYKNILPPPPGGEA